MLPNYYVAPGCGMIEKSFAYAPNPYRKSETFRFFLALLSPFCLQLGSSASFLFLRCVVCGSKKRVPPFSPSLCFPAACSCGDMRLCIKTSAGSGLNKQNQVSTNLGSGVRGRSRPSLRSCGCSRPVRCNATEREISDSKNLLKKTGTKDGSEVGVPPVSPAAVRFSDPPIRVGAGIRGLFRPSSALCPLRAGLPSCLRERVKSTPNI